jgi:hypothetical protein
MLDVFVCHSPGDREVAAVIAARLERGAETNVWLDECGSHSGQTVAAAWEAGLTSAAILLLLSPDAVPLGLRREDWQSLLRHLERNADPPVGAVLLEDCHYPRLLERSRFFHWRDSQPEALRAIERWIISLHPRSERLAFIPAPLPWFEGRQQELDTMGRTLVDGADSLAIVNSEPGSGKTSLAQEFARLAGGHFRDILWVECGDRWPASVAGDLASQLGVTSDAWRTGAAGLDNFIQEHRLLLVFDDVLDTTPIVAPFPSRASVLITTRSTKLRLPPHVCTMPIDSAVCPAPVQPPSASVDRKLFEAISVCRRQGFPLAFAAQIANIEPSEVRAACQRLEAQRWIDPLDTSRARFRHGAHFPIAASLETDRAALHSRHAEALNVVFSGWRTDSTICREALPELKAGFEWAMHSNWSLAVTLASRAFAFLSAEGRWPEAADIYIRLRDAARERGDSQVVESCAWELSWIQDEGGEIRRPPAGGQLALEFC